MMVTSRLLGTMLGDLKGRQNTFGFYYGSLAKSPWILFLLAFVFE
jgi:hypothetical protein